MLLSRPGYILAKVNSLFPTILNCNRNLINRASEYTHLGHIISVNLNDSCEILSKRNSLCGKINNVLCYFHNRNPVVKLKFLRSYCSDFYGSGLWELGQPSVEDVCITWRKGLKRVSELPTRTHSGLVAPLCGLLPWDLSWPVVVQDLFLNVWTVLTALLGLLLDKVCSIKECIHPLAVMPSILLLFLELQFLNLHQSTKNGLDHCK